MHSSLPSQTTLRVTLVPRAMKDLPVTAAAAAGCWAMAMANRQNVYVNVGKYTIHGSYGIYSP